MDKRKRVSNYLKVNGSFLQLPHKTILSKEFNDLSFSTRCIYLALLTKWHRDKDKAEKEFICTYEEIIEMMQGNNKKRLSSQTISNCLRELDKKDFISIVYGGKNNPSKYRINTLWLK